ncbi:MAG: T9SS type A sorting domain-containing protein [Flavobacteriales bacterium]|nr:T9SS type A sorting domain-containing protein [Flavobacteriales bacterium]MCB9447937.1 T9SS type A sorting domain-containing protein [Flavobacteriales bacterium]
MKQAVIFRFPSIAAAFAFLCIISVSVKVDAQCTPDPQYTNSGIYPDSATNLPPAYVGTPYAETITLVVPADTFLGTIPVKVDSVVLTGFDGLPAGFTYACNPSKCSWKGGESGCVLISGTATAGMEGTYPLKGYVESYAASITVPFRDTVTYLRLVVMPPQGVGEEGGVYVRTSAFPNPADHSTQLSIGSLIPGEAEIRLVDVTGRQVWQTTRRFVHGDNLVELPLNTCANGLYMYHVALGPYHAAGRIVVAHP